MAVPRESKGALIPPDSDSRKRRAVNAATVAVSSSSSQLEGSRAVAETQQSSMAGGSRMDVGEEEREMNSGVRKHRTSNDE